MAFYAIVGRLGLCGRTRPARGCRAPHVLGLLLLYVLSRGVVYFISRYMANSPHVYLPLKRDNNPYGLWKSWHGWGITLDIGSAWITMLSAFCQI